MNFEIIIKTEQWIKNIESIFITNNQVYSEGYTGTYCFNYQLNY